ncbi:hypothetical protein DPMN_037388 [Dreissena polymorpha]|uniref:Uncharacterized protein n=1 Tax=Dreissena polymorpha TaxID=45954 RepID=A0A9D4MDB1_DREPO|nr:hypothetical protein DPMN_037388 [Dreissena polymorpha]
MLPVLTRSPRLTGQCGACVMEMRRGYVTEVRVVSRSTLAASGVRFVMTHLPGIVDGRSKR